MASQVDLTNNVITMWYKPPELLLGEQRCVCVRVCAPTPFAPPSLPLLLPRPAPPPVLLAAPRSSLLLPSTSPHNKNVTSLPSPPPGTLTPWTCGLRAHPPHSPPRTPRLPHQVLSPRGHVVCGLRAGRAGARPTHVPGQDGGRADGAHLQGMQGQGGGGGETTQRRRYMGRRQGGPSEALACSGLSI